MREFNTAPLDVKQTYTTDFQTHPFECGWAREGIFYIEVEAITDGTELNAAVQISNSGIAWANEGTGFPPITAPGLYFVRVIHFGGWLRLSCTLSGPAPSVRVNIQLALKE